MHKLSLCAIGIILSCLGVAMVNCASHQQPLPSSSSSSSSSSSPSSPSASPLPLSKGLKGRDLTSSGHEVATSNSALVDDSIGDSAINSLSSGHNSRPSVPSNANSDPSDSYVKPVEHLTGDYGIRTPSLPLRSGIPSQSSSPSSPSSSPFSAFSSFSPSRLLPSLFSSGNSRLSVQRLAMRPINKLLDLFPRYDYDESQQHLAARNSYPVPKLHHHNRNQHLAPTYHDNGINSLSSSPSSFNTNEHLMKQGSISQASWFPYRGQTSYPPRRSTLKSFFDKFFG